MEYQLQNPPKSVEVLRRLYFQRRDPIQVRLMEVKEATGFGNTQEILGRPFFAAQIPTSAPAINATIHIEGRINGSDWVALTPKGAANADITAAGIYQFEGLYDEIRPNVTVYVAGKITVDLLAQA
ncbi:MAG: hypothetical protein ACYCX4_01710 [Bacillota bacterium]